MTTRMGSLGGPQSPVIRARALDGRSPIWVTIVALIVALGSIVLGGTGTAIAGSGDQVVAPHALGSGSRTTSSDPPPPGGYFHTVGVGGWSSLPSDDACARKVHHSTWEPRPDNTKRDNVMQDPVAVHASFAERPRSRGGAYAVRWDNWLLPRVDGQFTGTTDEIFQWGACKWGLRDDLVRAIAVRE